jgi:ribosomal protein L37AE/L43A
MTTTERKSKTLAELAAEASDTKEIACPRCGDHTTRAVGDGVRCCVKCGREFTAAR